MSAHPSLSSVDAVTTALADHDYLADRGLATTIFLATSLNRPLLLEGEAGVGKTEVAKVLAAMTGGELIRLQCYEGIDANQALYEWNYTAQLLHLRTAEATGTATAAGADELEEELFRERFLVRRPLLRAIDHGGDIPPVLLIDEVDRADDEFEAFLLEALSDFSITIPELGTFTADVPPIVIITSNRTRDVHDALKRRALHHWVEHPDFEREVAIAVWRAASSESSACISRPAWPRLSTGPTPCICWARPSSPRRLSTQRWAPCSSTARIRTRSAVRV